MDQVQVYIVYTESLQTLINSLGNAFVPFALELGSQPNLFARDAGCANTLADFALVAIGERGIDMAIACSQGCLDRHINLVRSGLPGSKTDSRDFGTCVEGIGTTCSMLDCV